jgi:hypothetical protein
MVALTTSFGRSAPQRRRRPTLRFHDLRHADTGMTYWVYLYFFPDDFSADMERLDAYIAPAQRPADTAPVPLPRAEG